MLTLLIINVKLFVSRHIEYLCVDLSEFISPFAFRTNDGKRSTNLSRQRRVHLAWKAWIRRRKLPRWHVWKTAYPSCQPSTICFLYQLPAPVKTLKCTQSPPASLGRVEFFNSHNSVARRLSPSLFPLPSSPRTLWCRWHSSRMMKASRTKHCIITWNRDVGIVLLSCGALDTRARISNASAITRTTLRLIKRLEAAKNKIASDLNKIKLSRPPSRVKR